MMGPILDMRSKAYIEINPVPAGRDAKFVEVLDEDSGKALNHFNKKAKGAFVRAALKNKLESFDQVSKVAKAAGLRSEVTADQVLLFVPKGF
jgi:cytoplasmic iron level regulating protein YaaA (DUF328/UPF0246 family)